MENNETITGKPLQRIPWSKKVADKKQWFKDTAQYYLSGCSFGMNIPEGARDLDMLYQVYNNKFPEKWFSHITDPLSAKDKAHKRFPARIRPISILRTNIDLLLNEYPRRPFVYQVINRGEEGYNKFTESLKTKIEANLTEHFVAMMQQEALQQGVPVNEIPGMEEIELPESVKEKHNTSYKDNEAIRGQKWLKRAMDEYKIKEKFQQMFKDWVIVGSARSYKGIERGNLWYERVSPKHLNHDKSEDLEYIEDGEWAVCRRYMTYSDVVDHFYDDLTDENHNELESRNYFASPHAFFEYLPKTSNDRSGGAGKIPVYHVVWKGKKAVKVLSYPDPLTGQMQELDVDEDYPVNKEAGETAKTIWVNEVYEAWRIGDNIWARMQPIPCQRNEMNNISVCKLPYNGKNFSDLHSENISPMELGIPIQIMYMIINRTLEMTIAKSKGKIFLVDKNSIPRGDGWNDEKFFYYSEALGYGLLNRNQQGVDKTWNQYQVIDMGLFDQISQLIELQNHYKQQWDDLLGINLPRKGATQASAGKAVTQINMNQSSVITDGIFNWFEKFTERELQGMLDYSKYTNADGIRSIYNGDDFTNELLNIDPNTYADSELGVFVSSSAEEMIVLEELKQQVQPLIQNGTKASTLIEIFQSSNVAELKQKLRKVEELEASLEQQLSKDQQDLEAAADARKMRFMEYENLLTSQLVDKEWDRKDQNTMIKGEFDLASAANLKGDGDADNNGIPDVNEIEKRVIDRQKIFSDEALRKEEIRQKERASLRETAMRNKEIESKERIAKEKAITDRKKIKYSKKSK